jgi:protocatechuate 3,4-dioxygenase, alpha subunit
MTKLSATASQTAGPFVHLGLTDHGSVARLASEEYEGEHIRLRCRMFDGDGMPVTDAIIEIWQADSAGNYAQTHEARTKSSRFRGFGRLALAEDGSCLFETIKPGCVAGPASTRQAPHINVSIFARGLLKRLATRIYFENERNNDKDPVLGLVPPDRRRTLMARQNSGHPNEWEFVIRLCCENETVFFDV